VDQIILFGSGAVDRVLRVDEAFHNRERNHRGLEPIDRRWGNDVLETSVHVRELLGGLLNYYYPRAA
jgi:hypothetical protein